jgi:hypothetical protein
MDIISAGRKDRHLNTFEKYHIYKLTKNLDMNDKHIEIHNPIFQITHELYDR